MIKAEKKKKQERTETPFIFDLLEQGTFQYELKRIIS